jgi:EAL domain-containing protein (putative c-di-GMP-specific phosphodiesterase class I)
LKIDRSFVSGSGFAPDERLAFLKAMISLAKSLNLHTVAEGIETTEQLHELTGMGCESGQGYLWSPAVSGAQLVDLIEVINRPSAQPATLEDALAIDTAALLPALSLTEPNVPSA